MQLYEVETYLRARIEKAVIVGTGCAGLTAALYTGRANLRPLVLTGKQLGDLLATTSRVEKFPGFPPHGIEYLVIG